MQSKKTNSLVSRILIYAILILITALMLIPFIWMISASLKMNKDVFSFPIQWIPDNPRWQNYVDIWTKIPLLTFVKNSTKLTIIVTLLQLFTSSFAAYAFAKMEFRGKNLLFLGYIATIAVPWQAYMVPQFMMMRSWNLNNTHLAIICLQAFSAFGVFLMKQFYEGVPSELCEATRIDGLSEYGIVIVDEVPAVGVNSGGSRNPYEVMKIKGHHEDVIRDMIARDKNHPSVVMWPIANEPDTEHFPQAANSVPDFD